MEKHIEHKRQSGSFWAYVLIIFGILWILKESGWDIHFPGIQQFFAGIGQFFVNMSHWSVGASIPVCILLLGLAIILGRRFFGALLFVILLMVFTPHFLIIPGLFAIILFPLILIIIGIVILSKLF